ncbi:MAG: TatD family deoxyribonuclease [Gammaproteobacteria bacterium]|nr:MAG: TatD family deoxyribonuclease [Gammaproteobacteria bacterium]UTW43834.1 TatD family hydrolase [bacterium SCSIO 12844]
MFIDTHCHLDFDIFNHDRDKLINQAKENDITHFINPSVSKNNWHNVLALSKEYNNIIPVLGMHPCFIKEHHPSDLNELETQLSKNKIKLLGEIGLDKRINQFEEQLFYFSEQLSIAKKLNLPVIIHSVKAHSEVIHQIKSLNFTLGGIIHAFNGSIEIAKTYIDLGFKLGIGSILTYPKNKLTKIINTLPLSSFVLETDSPDMLPYNYKNNRNTPLSILIIFDLLCQNRNESKLEIKYNLWHNSCLFFD